MAVHVREPRERLTAVSSDTGRFVARRGGSLLSSQLLGLGVPTHPAARVFGTEKHGSA